MARESSMDFTLTRKLLLLTAIKLAALAAIYVLFFATASHAPIDVATRIAGPAGHP
jgi:hypothetical protein